MKPIYEPKGKAKEYGDYAINIYIGCPHRCWYCYAPRCLHVDKEAFHSHVEPRKNIVEEVRKQIEREQITGKLIHLCFTCDPYPTGYDSTPTREIIKILKESGNHVQILTKGDGSRDFDLLDGDDWYGITIDGSEILPDSAVEARLSGFQKAARLPIKTWISFEPVLDDDVIIGWLKAKVLEADKIKIGKLNYFPSNIDWKEFGEEIEYLCRQIGVEYYIKDSLRKEMER